LDGKLSDIKKAYKNNIYKVGLGVHHANGLLEDLKDKFEILSSEYVDDGQQLNFTVQLPSDDTGSFLSHLSGKANVNNFMETIPSANDIFIRTVQSK
jgi:ABC-2 type transport system ATP-binding protein